ncbi:cold-shock protein [Devosia aurantiaca]|uniref:Cold shock domain-containing protein n=1 Tax=Devosia aurantiaca TaxID=2714858 RepID=A0A6M1S9U0_9HYPH|nr:cold shock domain-containing protein [Devosia aurantiaca]NGP16769.1 cold shock domain-containing protein [Devosia aurantiaca]
MKLSGELVQWNDERGFGFIAGDDGVRYFVHITSIARIVNRPRAGDRVTFTSSKDREGRLQAMMVAIAGAIPVRHVKSCNAACRRKRDR